MQKLRSSDGTVALTARMPAEMAALIQRVAARDGVTASRVVREAVAEQLQPERRGKS